MGKFGKFSEASVAAGTATGTGSNKKKLHSSSGIVDSKVAHGQTVKRAFPLDTSDMSLPNEQGLEGFGGSPTSVRHSLSGASVVQDNGPGGNKSKYIPNH
jgi:hypothetical protein